MKDKIRQAFNRQGAPYIKELAFFIAFLSVFLLTYVYFFTHITVDVTLNSVPDNITDRQSETDFPPPTQEVLPTAADELFQIYYAGKNQAYSEKRSYHFQIQQNKNHFRLQITRKKSIKTLRFYGKLRIDPMRRTGKIFLKRIEIKQTGYKPLILETHDQFIKLLRPINDIERVEYTSQGMAIFSSGEDPQLELFLNPKIVEIDFLFIFKLLFSIVLIGSVLFILLGAIKKEDEFIYAPYLLTFILALAFATASVCELMHADEPVHVRAGNYYEDHWLPPEICDPATENTYSVFGASRLNNYEVVYFLAGKFSKLLTFLDVRQFLRFRLFNIFLFFILLVLSIKHVEYRILTLPLLVSPQIWYLFTYFNSDAFSIFIIIIISYQVISQKSVTNSYLTSSENNKRTITCALLAGLLFSTLLLIKLNFFIFIIFLLFVFLLKLGFKEYLNPKRVILRVGLIMLIAATIFGLRWGIDVGINGFNRKEKLAECRKKLAKPMFSIATPLKDRYHFLRLKERNVPLRDLFEKYNWGSKTFSHSFGVYFFKPEAKDWYYKFIMVVCIFFALYLAGSIIIGLKADQIILLGVVVFCSILLIAASLWNSWTASFQAQGRYLFAIFIMTGFLMFQSLPNLNKKILNFFILLMFCLSVFSYVFIGLLQLPKV